MHWYGGSMVEAVTLSKQRNAIFVVFIEGEDDLSRQLSSTIDDSVVVKRLANQQDFLAVKLQSGSENYTHFAKIYQFVPVPSLFFIGRNGTPLEVVCAGLEAKSLADRIDRILEEHRKEKQVHPSTSGQNIREQTSNLLQAEATANPPAPGPASATPPATAPAAALAKPNSPEPDPSEPAAKVAKTEHHEVTKSGQEYEVVCDGDVCVRRPRAGDGGGAGPSQRADTTVLQQATTQGGSESAASVQDKVEHAKEVMDALRKEKAEKEKELEKQKEKERRATGQGVAELKRWQADQELKQIQEERKREKLENNLARQRILEQIAQDRAERRARDQPPPPAAPAPHLDTPHPPPTAGDGSGRARVQFKLPDGAAHTAHFDDTAPISHLHAYVADNLQMSRSSFSLWTAFPRRELTDSSATLLELQLAPSAALLVLPRRTAAAVASPSGVSSVITFLTQLFTSLILDPSYAVYAWLRARVLPHASSDPPAPPAAAPGAPGASPGAPGASPGAPGASPGGPGASAGLRRRGNVHRLGGDRSSDDDNNTWNGNSTQQM